MNLRLTQEQINFQQEVIELLNEVFDAQLQAKLFKIGASPQCFCHR